MPMSEGCRAIRLVILKYPGIRYILFTGIKRSRAKRSVIERCGASRIFLWIAEAALQKLALILAIFKKPPDR